MKKPDLAAAPKQAAPPHLLSAAATPSAHARPEASTALADGVVDLGSTGTIAAPASGMAPSAEPKPIPAAAKTALTAAIAAPAKAEPSAPSAPKAPELPDALAKPEAPAEPAVAPGSATEPAFAPAAALSADERTAPAGTGTSKTGDPFGFSAALKAVTSGVAFPGGDAVASFAAEIDDAKATTQRLLAPNGPIASFGETWCQAMAPDPASRAMCRQMLDIWRIQSQATLNFWFSGFGTPGR